MLATRRLDALNAGMTHYFTGKPCSRGHVARRWTSNGVCVECEALKIDTTAAERARRYRQRHPDRIVEQNRAQMQSKAEYRERNREAIRESGRVYYAANAERRNAVIKLWQQRNPERFKALVARRRARLAGAEGHYTAEDIARITEQQKGRCACCRKPRKLTVDHIIPLTKGGSNWPSNIQMLCQPCNSRKHNRDPIEFSRASGMLL